MRTHRGTRRAGRVGGLHAAVVGLVAGGAFLAVADAAARLTAQQSGPLTAVGSFVIDIVPGWVKDATIQIFGTNDKLFLLVTLGIAAVILAMVTGMLERAFAPAGQGAIALTAAGVLAASVTRADASPWAFLPAVVGAAVAITVLRVLDYRLARWLASARPEALTGVQQQVRPGPQAREGGQAAVDRRSFLRLAGLSTAGVIAVGVLARAGQAATSSITSIRDALRLPHPRRTVAVPEGADLPVPGITPLFTPNADFYRVDTALVVPQIVPADWQLTVDGMVDHPVKLGFDDLLAMGLDEYVITLTCVSNEVGGDLVGNARWLGVPVRDVLRRAAPQAGADMVLSRSVDGFTAGTPLELLADPGRDAILAVGMNGRPLPLVHGFPVRMIVPGLYGYVSATKWLQKLTVTTFAASTAYWTTRGYSATAPIKMSSRIDTPRLGDAVHSGPVKIAGVAWAQPVGIARVDVKIDDGLWRRARLSTPINGSTWVQWIIDWQATRGDHRLTVRAVDRNGTMQEHARHSIVPNGSTGWQQTFVTVS